MMNANNLMMRLMMTIYDKNGNDDDDIDDNALFFCMLYIRIVPLRHCSTYLFLHGEIIHAGSALHTTK